MSATEIRQAGRWESIVACLGAVLIGLLWGPWYDHAYAGWTTYAPGGGALFHEDVSGWSAGLVTSIVVAVFAVACVAQALVLRATRAPAVGLTWNVALTWAAMVVAIWLGVRLAWPPGDGFGALDPAWAGWASLAVTAAILVANWMGMRDERDDPALVRDLPIRPIPPRPISIADR